VETKEFDSEEKVIEQEEKMA